MEKRDDSLYIRSKPSIKKWWLNRAKKDGFDNFAYWFEEFTENEMKKLRRAKKKK